MDTAHLDVPQCGRHRERLSVRLLAGTIAAALLLCPFSTFGGAAPERTTGSEQASLGVVYADGRRTEDIVCSRLEEGSDELYVSAYDLARVFKATKFWNPSSRKLVLKIDIYRYLLTLDTRVVVVDEEPVLMRVPVKYEDGSVMIPLEFISEVLAPRSFEKIELDGERLVLTIGSPQYNVTDISFEDDENGTRAVLTLTEELLYHVDSDTPGLLRLKIYGGKLNPLKFSASETKGLFNKVRAEQTEHDAYVFLDVKTSAARFRIEYAGSGGGEGGKRDLVIYLERSELPEIPDVEFAGRRMVEILDDASAGREGVSVRRIAIDPGHGGIDNGKVSTAGVMEKDVNLEIAMLLRRVLVEELGVDVVMTRTGDDLVPLDQRAGMANSAGADLFISLHCNGWFHSDAGGFETFFLAPARTEEESRLAREENASIRYENPELKPEEIDVLEFILWDMVQNEFINESSGLAELIQRELSKVLDIRNRGVKQAGLKVLKGLRMPAVLVEMAFLSNPREEQLLLDQVFRHNLVQGIVEGIRRYQNRYATAQPANR